MSTNDDLLLSDNVQGDFLSFHTKIPWIQKKKLWTDYTSIYLDFYAILKRKQDAANNYRPQILLQREESSLSRPGVGDIGTSRNYI